MANDIDAVFDGYAPSVRPALQRLRDLVRGAAQQHGETGGLEETLKWGQPAFLPKRPRVGTTIRLDAVSDAPPRVALYVHCQTSLVDRFRAIYPDVFGFEGNRAIVLEADKPLPEEALRHCIGMALTYHAAKRATVTGG